MSNKSHGNLELKNLTTSILSSNSQQLSSMETNFNGELIVVGEKGSECSIEVLALTIHKSKALKDSCKTFATFLAKETTLDVKKLYKDYSLLDKIQFVDFVVDVLNHWVAKHSGKAKLSIVLKVLEDDCADTISGETLRLRFNLPCLGCENPDLKFSDLSLGFQKKVRAIWRRCVPEHDIEEKASELSPEQLIKLMKGESLSDSDKMEMGMLT